MKQLASISINYGKVLKSLPEDKNEEKVYAEVNIITHEPEYVLQSGRIEKNRKLSEVEISISKEDARLLKKAFTDIYKKIVELEKLEK